MTVYVCPECGGDEYNCFCNHVEQPCGDNPQPCGCNPCCCQDHQGSCLHMWEAYQRDTADQA